MLWYDWCFCTMGQAIYFLPTNSRCCLFKETTYIEVKISFFRAVKSTLLWNLPYFIALGASLLSQGYHFPILESTSQQDCVYKAFVTAVYLGPYIFQLYLSTCPQHCIDTYFIPRHCLRPHINVITSLCLWPCVHPSDWDGGFLFFIHPVPTHSFFFSKTF